MATCQVYQQAPEVAKQGERTMSTDELTGVQALERKHPACLWPLEKWNAANLSTFVMAPAPLS